MMNIIEYFEFLTGLKPTENQKKLLEEAINMETRKIIISSGFQAGKSLCTAVIVMWYMFEYPEPLKIILISAQENIIYMHIREMFDRHPELIEQLGGRSKLAADLIPIHGFELEKGSMVFIRGATEKQIRGIPADIVVIDEACLVKNDIILSTIGRLTGKIAKLILLSTPDNETSLFVKWATEEDSGFKVFQWPATIKECPWHNEEQEKLKEKEYSKQQYASLVLGRPPTKEERAFFNSKDVEACMKSVEPIREGGPLSRIEIGIDFGEGKEGSDRDSTVLVITERIGVMKRKVLFIKIWEKKDRPPDICGPEILEIIAKWKPYMVKGDSKPEEYNDWFKRHGNKVKMVDMAIHKENMMGQLQRMIRSHGLIIPTDFTYLMVALQKYRLRRGEGYFKGKGAKTAGSDLVEALALSCYETESLQSSTGGIVVFPRREED